MLAQPSSISDEFFDLGLIQFEQNAAVVTEAFHDRDDCERGSNDQWVVGVLDIDRANSASSATALRGRNISSSKRRLEVGWTCGV